MEKNKMDEGIPTKLKEEKKEKVGRILACVGDYEDFGNPKNFEDFAPFKEDAHIIDYSSPSGELSDIGFLNGGDYTYVFSVLDGADKFSTGFYDCTGMVVAGVDKETGEKISFVTHQDPKRFLWDKSEQFMSHLHFMLEKIKERCAPETIDAVIFGGNYLPKLSKLIVTYQQSYENSVKMLNMEVKNALGFEPVIINGPKTVRGSDDMYYDNDNRRLYFMRPELNRDTPDFKAGDIDKLKDKWK